MGNTVQKIRARLVMERARAHGLPPPQAAVAVFYQERSRSPEGRKSSTGGSSSEEEDDDESWTSAQDVEDSLGAALNDFEDPEGALSDLLARTGEDDFMKAVLSFCSYMDGRMDALDNSKIYDEFRSYTALGPLNVPVA